MDANYDYDEDFLEIEILGIHVRLGLLLGSLLVIIFGVCGNLVALIIILKSGKTSSSTKLYLLSMTLSDLLLTAVSTTTDIDQIMDCFHSWGFGVSFCKIQAFLEFLFLMANSFSLLIMVGNRYWLMYMLLYTKTPSGRVQGFFVAAVALVIVWASSVGLSISYVGEYEVNYYNCSWVKLPSSTNSSTSEETEMHYGVSGGAHFIFDTVLSDVKGSSVIFCHWIPRDVENLFSETYCYLRDGKRDVPSKIALCEPGRGTARKSEMIYHVVMGVVFVLLIISLLIGFFFLWAAGRAEKNMRRQLPPSSLWNMEVMQNVRLILSNRRRGIRLLMYIVSLLLIFRLPLWILIASGATKIYASRSSTMLATYFLLHLLGNLKSAITAYIYAHSNKALQFYESNFNSTRSNKHNCVSVWRAKKSSNFVLNDIS